MPRYTKAYSKLIDRLAEVKTLYQLAARKERSNPIRFRDEVNALTRGCIVLLSSHLEAYIKELGETALESLYLRKIPRAGICDRFYYHISKDIFDQIEETSDPDSISKKVFDFIQRDASYWSHSGVFPDLIPADRFNAGFSTPKFENIRKYLSRFGYEGYKNDLCRQLGILSQPTINSVNHLVDIRNKIAHGDMNVSKTPSDIKFMLYTISTFCRFTDVVFANWWKKKFCSIR